MTAPTQARRMDGAGDAAPQRRHIIEMLGDDAAMETLDAVNDALGKIGGLDIPDDPFAQVSWLCDFVNALAAPAVKQPQQPNPAPPPSLMDPWKVGSEFAPFHPDASHVPPDWRDGWNACFRAAIVRFSGGAE